MKKYTISTLVLFGFLFISMSVQAQDFVYKPVNPAFGGEVFNYQWLLNSAQIQDLIEDPDAVDPFNRNNTLDDFTESLNRQLLSQLSRQIIGNQFGETSVEDGNYTIGNFQIDIASTLDGVTITIYDTELGEQTQLIIPFY